MVKRYRFLFAKNFINNHGQIVISKGTSGSLVFDDIKVHLFCDRIVKSQGTSCFTIKFDYLRDVVLIEGMNFFLFEERQELNFFQNKIETFEKNQKRENIGGF